MADLLPPQALKEFALRLNLAWSSSSSSSSSAELLFVRNLASLSSSSASSAERFLFPAQELNGARLRLPAHELRAH